jgi:aspartate/methionine/tyrosine aminotransferase
VKFAGAVPVPVDCPQQNGFKLRAEDLEAAITPRTKWLFLNFPNNPTGAACSRAEMQAIAEVMLRHPHVWIMTDDMYEHLIYDGFEFCTIAQVEPRLKDRVLTVNGASKAYAMTGWRLGFCGGRRISSRRSAMSTARTAAAPRPSPRRPSPRCLTGRRTCSRNGRRSTRSGAISWSAG